MNPVPKERKSPCGETHQGHSDVVDGDAEEHHALVGPTVHGHGFAALDVLQRHIDVAIAEDQAHEAFVVLRRKRPDHHGQGEYREGQEQLLASGRHDLWHLRAPEAEEATARSAFVAVDVLVQPRGQAVEVHGDVALRIEGAGVGEVVVQLDVQAAGLVTT